MYYRLRIQFVVTILILSLLLSTIRIVQCNPSIGNYTALIVLIQFSDHGGRTLPDPTYYLNMCNVEISKYMQQQSYGQYNIQCDVVGWAFTNNTEAYYSAGVSNQQGPDLSANFAIPVLNTLDTQLNMDWSKYDTNNDGAIDSILFIHSGYAAEKGDDNNYCNANTADNRIQSMAGPYSTAWTNNGNIIRLEGYAIASAYEYICDSTTPATMGVMTHEWLHTLGAIDLYDPNRLEGGIGSFDIMSNAYGPIFNGNLPGSLSPYSKILIGWVNATEIEYDGVYSIRTSNRYPDYYIISKPYPPGEYLLIENRQLLDSDAQLPGGGGLLIYHIDEEAPFGQSAPGYPQSVGWPMDHYQVALLQADGSYDLERGINTGDSGDYYTAQTRELLPGSYGFYPNTDSYQFGELTVTGLFIKDISTSNINMNFTISGLGTIPTQSPTISPTNEIIISSAIPTQSPNNNNNVPNPITDTSSANTVQNHVVTIASSTCYIIILFMFTMFF